MNTLREQTHRIAVLHRSAILALLAACAGRVASPAPVPARSGEWTDGAGHVNRVIPIDNTTVHAIDYGGTGPVLVFLAGLGNSTHVFDEFAPRFADRYHVLAITRRGYGESGQPDGGYDTDRLTADVHDVLDSLGIGRAALVGHSVAGDELTEFGARYPERTSALVYLEAAYDRSHTQSRLFSMAATRSLPPGPPRPSASDRSSVAAYRAYLAHTYGVTWPASEVKATRVFDNAGQYVRDVSAGARNLAVMRGEHAPRYDALRVPALAIYATERGIDRDFPWISAMTIGRANARTAAERYLLAEENWEATSRKGFAQAVRGARVITVPHASHYVFLSHPDLVERAVREFLGEQSVAR